MSIRPGPVVRLVKIEWPSSAVQGRQYPFEIVARLESDRVDDIWISIMPIHEEGPSPHTIRIDGRVVRSGETIKKYRGFGGLGDLRWSGMVTFDSEGLWHIQIYAGYTIAGVDRPSAGKLMGTEVEAAPIPPAPPEIPVPPPEKPEIEIGGTVSGGILSIIILMALTQLP